MKPTEELFHVNLQPKSHLKTKLNNLDLNGSLHDSLSNENQITSLSCVIASTPEDFEQVNNLWKEVYVNELSWLSSQERCLFEDAYHPHSVYILARIDNQPAGTMRLVFDSPEGLPLEKFCSLGLLKKHNQRSIEAQRLMVSPLFRQVKRSSIAPFGIFSSIIKAGFHYCFINDVSHIFVDAFLDTPTTPIKTFKTIGFEEIGSPFMDTDLSDSSKSIAMVIDTVKLLSKSYRKQGKFFSYLLNFDPNFNFY